MPEHNNPPPDVVRTRSARGRRLRYLAPAVAGVLAVTAFGATSAGADTPIGSASLRDANGTAIGRVRFYDRDGRTVVRATINGNAHVTPGQFHGFHIHVGKDPASGTAGCIADPAKPANTWFVSAGGHLKVDAQLHASHTGDLQSLLVDADGNASSTFTTDRFSPGDLAGRVVILHAAPDNFGNVPTGSAADQYTANRPAAATKTGNTGNAGDRVACGEIRVGSGDH